MKQTEVKAAHGGAIISPGEIIRMWGDWTTAELIRLQWKLEFLEGG